MTDKKIYLQATEEFSRGEVDPALWAKAMAEAAGEEKAAKYRYIELRVRELKPAVAIEATRAVVGASAEALAGAASRAANPAKRALKWALIGLPIVGLGVVLLLQWQADLQFSGIVAGFNKELRAAGLPPLAESSDFGAQARAAVTAACSESDDIPAREYVSSPCPKLRFELERFRDYCAPNNVFEQMPDRRGCSR